MVFEDAEWEIKVTTDTLYDAYRVYSEYIYADGEEGGNVIL